MTLIEEDQSRQKNDQNVEVVRAVMAKYRWLSVRTIAEETGLDKNAVHRILTVRVWTDLADDWVLHGNAPPHTAFNSIISGEENIPVLPNPAPCDFCLFLKLKSKLKGHHIRTIENKKKIVTNELHTLTENYFRYCYDQW
jgi:hypothetical protein